MIRGLIDLHSTLRYFVVIALILSILSSYIGFSQKKKYEKSNDKINLYAFILIHIQLLLGLILYFFVSPYVQFSDMAETMKNPIHRFYSVEHIAGMLIGITLITVGRIKAKKITDDVKKHKTTFIFYLIGFIVIFVSIPWPFLKSFGTWF